MTQPTDVKEIVKHKYGEAATRVAQGASNACCGAGRGDGCGTSDPITSNLYDALQAGEVPETAMLASLGCGNPTALAELKPGETVLDLGSGGGIDVLLSAKRVGPSGKAFGLDMTDQMLALAEENKRKSGLTNVHFLKCEIENIPLPDNSVDVIISNCVINLSGDKDRVLKEAFRVLKPGGRFAVSDVVVRGDVPPLIRKSMELWVGCVAGALTDRDYLSKLAAAGFENADIEVTRVYSAEDSRDFLAGQGADVQQLAQQVDGKFVSGFIRAVKPPARPAGDEALGNATQRTESSALHSAHRGGASAQITAVSFFA
jgi:2-polyprenyl-3-methyl-5-hydroxy-6-metoxy-1,4-benzoquinol methylase